MMKKGMMAFRRPAFPGAQHTRRPERGGCTLIGLDGRQFNG